MTMKSCNSGHCMQSNPQDLSNFYSNKRNKDGLYNKCKECVKFKQIKYKQTSKGQVATQKTKKRYNQNPNGKLQNTRNRLKREYNLTIEEHKQMFISQDYCCAICNKHQSEFKRTLH